MSVVTFPIVYRKQNSWSEIALLCNSFVLFVIWNRLKTRRAHGGAGGGRRSQCYPLRVGDCERQTPSGGVWRHWQGGRPPGLHPQTLSRWRVSGWLSLQKLPWLSLHFSSLSSAFVWARLFLEGRGGDWDSFFSDFYIYQLKCTPAYASCCLPELKNDLPLRYTWGFSELLGKAFAGRVREELLQIALRLILQWVRKPLWQDHLQRKYQELIFWCLYNILCLSF